MIPQSMIMLTTNAIYNFVEKKHGNLEDMEIFNPQSAWIGPNIWGQGDRMYTDPNFKLEYMELDEFLQVSVSNNTVVCM